MGRSNSPSNNKVVELIKIYTGNRCPDCKVIVNHIKGKAVEITYVDTDTPEGYAEASLDDVYSLPTAMINGRRIVGRRAIIEAVGEYTP
jgi:glutaredoxin